MTGTPEASTALRVAVVDDDPTILAVMEQILADAGFAVRTFATAPPCIHAVQRGELDFIFTDINMPDMSGVELLRMVKALAADIEVVMMTGDARVDSAIESTRWGAVDYLQKPFDDIDAVAAVAHRVSQRVAGRRQEKAILAIHAEHGDQAFRFSGELSETSLPESLQALDAMGRDGILSLDAAVDGAIHLIDRRVVHATFGPVRGQKALYRAVREATGSYRFVTPDLERPSSSLNVPIETAVLEAVRRKDEFSRLSSGLPPLDGNWRMVTDCSATLSQIPPWLVGVVADVIRGGTASAALDSARYCDLEILQGLQYLWQLGAIRPA